MGGNLYDLSGRVAFITGGAGLLGAKHAEAIGELGGSVALVDIDLKRAESVAADLAERTGARVIGVHGDVTDPKSIRSAVAEVESELGHVGILVNNAANDPKVRAGDDETLTRFENLPLSRWEQDMAVGLTGAFICCQVIGPAMADRRQGSIINISSDLGIIAPDQRLYTRPELPEDQQPVKPATYSAVKHGLIGLTRYLSTYWADRNVRVNALAPGGVLAGQNDEFLGRVESRIPMGRLADASEYKGAIGFLSSDASSYMTGAVLVVDGGRSVW